MVRPACRGRLLGSVPALALGAALVAAACGGNGMSAGAASSALPSARSSSPLPNPRWPNEPAGLTPRTDWGLDEDLPTSGDQPIAGSPGWHVVSAAPPGSPRGWAQQVPDASAPLSPPSVYDFVYPTGMIEGRAPATVYYNDLDASEVYVGFWWKPSFPFDYGPNGNKVAFLFNGGGGAGGQQFLIMLPDGRLHVLPEYPGDYRWRRPNVRSTAVTLGAWHRIEWYCDLASGTLQWWLDGELQGSYQDLKTSRSFDMFQLSPTWGGNSGARKKHADHYWFDHVYLSAR
jgi:hypothetical protein